MYYYCQSQEILFKKIQFFFWKNLHLQIHLF